MTDTLSYDEISRLDLSTQKRIKKLEELVAIQCSHGNWNCNGYMMGMANGMILALHMMRDDKGDPPYLTKPKAWLDDLPPPDFKEGLPHAE